MGESIFLTLFFGMFLAVGVGILGFGAHSLNMSQKAAHWPTPPGIVTESDFVASSDSDGSTYQTKIAYSYSAMGRDFVGDKIAFGYTGSSDESYHRQIFDALPVDTSVAVRYDPGKPQQAVLSFGVNQSIKFLLIFGAIWTIFTLGMASMFWLSGQNADPLLSNLIVYSRGGN